MSQAHIGLEAYKATEDWKCLFMFADCANSAIPVVNIVQNNAEQAADCMLCILSPHALA